MNPNKALWEKGDFTRLAATMRQSGEALISDLGIHNGLKVLDLGCGDGTTAVPSARTGAVVTGIDIARNLVKAGNERARQEGLENLRIMEGDATHLDGVEDGTFDVSMSIFGAMFAPKPDDVAKEMVRVTKKGGRVIMGNWIPGDPTLVAQILKICSQYMPAPQPGAFSPMSWGNEEVVTKRFREAGISEDQISFTRKTFTFEASYDPAYFVSEFLTYYGPTMNAYEAAASQGKAEDLKAELETLFAEQNKSTTGTLIPATFLQVEVQC